MKHTNTKAVLLPVEDLLLQALTARKDTLTTMVWGSPGDPAPMAEPHRILDKDQPHLPLLFSALDKSGKGTSHAALCGLLMHKAEIANSVLDWLDKRRVEKFAGTAYDWEIASAYVVTAGESLSRPIPFGELTLVSSNKPMSAEKRRGYSVVFLPAGLQTWFEAACQTWDALSGELPAIPSRPTE